MVISMLALEEWEKNKVTLTMLCSVKHGKTALQNPEPKLKEAEVRVVKHVFVEERLLTVNFKPHHNRIVETWQYFPRFGLSEPNKTGCASIAGQTSWSAPWRRHLGGLTCPL